MILGIDGGGTKTAFLLCDTQGNVKKQCITSALHYQQIGFDGVAKLLKEYIGKICSDEQGRKCYLHAACIGVPGYGESLEATNTLKQIVTDCVPCACEIVNDVKLAWAGSLACKPGICVLAGTGSMAFAVDTEGRDYRSGGWGQYFGDEGSAFWIGLQACNIFSKMSDRRCERSNLYELIKKHYSLNRDFDLIDRVLQATDSRCEIAQLAKIVIEAAQQGDTYAENCMHAASKELALLVKGVLTQLHTNDDKALALSYSGGLFNAGTYMVNLLTLALAPYPVVVEKPILSSVQGACLYAALHAGIDMSTFLQTIRTNV